MKTIMSEFQEIVEKTEELKQQEFIDRVEGDKEECLECGEVGSHSNSCVKSE